MLENCASRIKETIQSEKFLVILICAFICSFATHGFLFANYAPFGDAVAYGIELDAQDAWFIQLGRFLLPLDTAVKGTITQPMLSGILSTLYIGVAAFFVCEILEFKEKWQWVLTPAFLCINVSIADLYSSFQFSAPPYLFAMLLCVTGVYCLKQRHNFSTLILSSVLFMISFGLYQAQIVVALLLMDLMIIMLCLNNEDKRKIWITIGLFILSVLIALVLYFVCLKLVLAVSGIQMPDSYNSVIGLRKLRFWQLVADTKADIYHYFSYYLGHENFLGKDARIANIILVSFTIVSVALFLYRKIRSGRLSLHNVFVSFLLLCAFPVISVLMPVAMREQYIRFYVCYAVCMFYPAIMLLQNITIKQSLKKGEKILTCICSFIVLFRTCVFTNELYTNQKVTYDRTVSLTTQIMNDLNNEEGYVPGESEVVFVGRLYRNENLAQISSAFDEFRKPYNAVINASPTYTDSLTAFIRMMGFNVNSVSDLNILTEIESNQETIDMPSFPTKGYISKKGQYYIVKVSAWGPENW